MGTEYLTTSGSLVINRFFSRVEAFYQALAAGETQREGDVLKVKNTKSGKTMQLTFYEGQGRKMVRFSAAPSAEN